MNVLVVGGGGREHALVWGLAKSPAVTKLWTTSENAGICQMACCVDIEDQGITALANWAEIHSIDLTVVGPEAQLTVGIVDEFRKRGLNIMGPTRAAAEIESSKAFAKELMVAGGIPTASFAVCESVAAARRHIRQVGLPVVVKADGLAAGKGVAICHTWEQVDASLVALMQERVFGEAGERVIIEEFLCGEEISVLAFVCGTDIAIMPTAQDHKAAFDGDQGPNTGGMGAYSPVPGLHPDFLSDVRTSVLEPTVAALACNGRPYSGVLYAGLMVSSDSIRVLEFNCRFGDPETQVLVPRLQSDLSEVLMAVATGRLNEIDVRWNDQAAVCVVLSSAGYPGEYEVGFPISGLEEIGQEPSVQAFHAGTAVRGNEIVTAGGRVLGVTAWGDSIRKGVERAYAAVEKVRFAGMHYRRDIGYRALAKQSLD